MTSLAEPPREATKTTVQRMASDLDWAHKHLNDPTAWLDTCRAIGPLGAMCDLPTGHAAGHFQVSDWLGRYGTAWGNA